MLIVDFSEVLGLAIILLAPPLILHGGGLVSKAVRGVLVLAAGCALFMRSWGWPL